MASQCSSSTGTFSIRSVIRGHHIYKMVWTPYVGEELILKTEDTNLYDKHAVAAMKDDAIVGHMPRSLSGISWFFLKSGGHITCVVFSQKWRSHNV